MQIQAGDVFLTSALHADEELHPGHFISGERAPLLV
jgi:hypothetical protein